MIYLSSTIIYALEVIYIYCICMKDMNTNLCLYLCVLLCISSQISVQCSKSCKLGLAFLFIHSFMMSQLNTPQHSKDLTLDLSDSKTYAYSFWFITQIPFFHFHSKCLHLFLKMWAAKIFTAFRILHWLFFLSTSVNFSYRSNFSSCSFHLYLPSFWNHIV